LVEENKFTHLGTQFFSKRTQENTQVHIHTHIQCKSFCRLQILASKHWGFLDYKMWGVTPSHLHAKILQDLLHSLPFPSATHQAGNRTKSITLPHLLASEVNPNPHPRPRPGQRLRSNTSSPPPPLCPSDRTNARSSHLGPR
jgi:hypothetical protein